MYRNEDTRKALCHRLGKSYAEVVQMSAEDLDALIEQHIGKKLTSAFSLKNMVNLKNRNYSMGRTLDTVIVKSSSLKMKQLIDELKTRKMEQTAILRKQVLCMKGS